MAGATAAKGGPPARRQVRADWGAKALVVCILAVLMAIPLGFVFLLVAEREQRAAGVTQEVSALQGGSQAVLGPMLIAPYVTPPPPRQPGDTGPAPTQQTGWYVVSPERGTTSVTVRGSTLHRGIFDVPVYEAAADVRASFGPPPKTINLPTGSTVDWSRALIVVGFSDLRGAKSDVNGLFSGAGGKTPLAFSPASGVSIGAPGASVVNPTDAASLRATSPGATTSQYGLAAAPAAAVLASPTGGDISISMQFTGAERLSVLPYAKSTKVQIGGDWPSPSFDGGFIPEHRSLGPHAFSADWRVPFIARGLSDAGGADNLSLNALGEKDLGVSFVPANNPYKNVQRALKYAVMFVGLIFLTFFVFESLSGKRLHAAQYVLIGLAQMVFYLLLLSLAEYVGFDLAFAGAATATVALIGLYAGAAFKSRTTGAVALGIFGVVYGLIYLLMRLEDFALLAGSVASFVGLSVAMYLTRNIDWYGGRAEPAASIAMSEGDPVPSAASA